MRPACRSPQNLSAAHKLRPSVSLSSEPACSFRFDMALYTPRSRHHRHPCALATGCPLMRLAEFEGVGVYLAARPRWRPGLPVCPGLLVGRRNSARPGGLFPSLISAPKVPSSIRGETPGHVPCRAYLIDQSDVTPALPVTPRRRSPRGSERITRRSCSVLTTSRQQSQQLAVRACSLFIGHARHRVAGRPARSRTNADSLTGSLHPASASTTPS